MGKKKKAVRAVEKTDLKVARKAAKVRHQPVVRALGAIGELGDQPQMVALCLGTIATALARRDARLAAAGARMLSAHALATGVKQLIKRSVDRTRPHLLIDEGRYETGTRGEPDGDKSSFPSGHTAGAVAVARAFARDYPEHAAAAYAGAALIAGIQLPKCNHFLSDVGVGAAIGFAAEAAVSWGYDRVAARIAPAPLPKPA